jgi:hypothetical protein
LLVNTNTELSNTHAQDNERLAEQTMGSVQGGTKDAYFVTKLMTWYWARAKNSITRLKK